jgi:uncharacterized protein (TIGR00304 family)
MRYFSVVALAALVAGVALVADAVVQARANLWLVVFVPVISGRSAEFLLGVVLLLVGLFLLPLSLWEPTEEELREPGATLASPSGNGAGGLVLVGPVPIFFGSWRNVSSRTRWIMALVGVFLLVVFVIVLVWH